MIDEARRLAPRFAARAAAHDRDGAFPADDFADLRAAGFFGLMAPKRLGGAGAGFADYAAIAYELVGDRAKQKAALQRFVDTAPSDEPELAAARGLLQSL